MLNRKIIVEKENNIANRYVLALVDRIGADSVVEIEDKYLVYSISFLPEYMPIVERGIAKLALTLAKLEFIETRLKLTLDNHNIVAVICALIYFDFETEEDYILNCVCGNQIYSIKGIINFNTVDLYDNWFELVALAESLLDIGDKEDMLNVANFLLSTRIYDNKSIFVVDYELMRVSNIAKGVMIDYVQLFEDNIDNLINIISQEAPCEVIIEKEYMSQRDIQLLSKLVKINQL